MIDVLKALAEPTRLRVVNLLAHRSPICVCDLMTVLNIEQSVVSRHLSTLRKAEVVRAERRGTWMFYQLDLNKLQDSTGLMNWVLTEAKHNDMLQNDIAALESSVELCC